MTSPARAELTQRVMTQRIHFSFASEDVNDGQPAYPPLQSPGPFLPGR
jgi:hypothetical protein